MKAAYVDTSCLVAIAFEERGAGVLARRLGAFDELISSNLLEAELLAAFLREGLDAGDAGSLLGAISWVVPDRPLHRELGRVFRAGRVRGADAWHLASALYLGEEPGDLTFLSLDQPQVAVAKALGFKT